MRLLLLLAAPLSVLCLHVSVPAPAGGVMTPGRLERWVRSGVQSLQWEQLDRCLRMSSLSEAECRQLAHLPLSAVAVYVSEPRAATGFPDKVLAVLPDSSGGVVGSKPGRRQQPFPGPVGHDAVLVLDPSPGDNFGHAVVLFYVDVNVTKKRCSHLDGVYLGDECLTLALKGRCQNQLKRRQAGPERLMGNGHGRRGGGGLCDVHFLPLVVGVGDRNRTQRLRCVDHTAFARCPQQLPLGPPTVPASSCELNKNTRRCHQQPLATQLSCRLYQTCDHAVLLSGGWQQLMTFQRHVENFQSFYKMLRINGFHKDHIKRFFAGAGRLPEDVEGVSSATEKAVIRNHVSYVCRKQHCADTLVLYLNSPTRNDGAMLLWDANLNGIADLKERYSVGELLADLAGCRAARVLLFVDQSYGSVLSKRLRGSQKHVNVVLIPKRPWHGHTLHSQRVGGAPEDGSWSSIRPAACLLDHLGKAPGLPQLLQPWAGLLNVTLAGAPCNATPPLTAGEMRREYQGCQNLPTALWHQKHRRPD